MSFSYKYARPAVTTDVVLLLKDEGKWYVLLIKRKYDPYQDHWALPGGFLDQNEDPDLGVARELKEETGITGIQLRQLGFWGRPDRDPRGHTVSLVYWACIDCNRPDAAAADDAKDLKWYPLDALPPLAFDHTCIIKTARSLIPSQA